MDADPSGSRPPAQIGKKPRWTREQKQAREDAKVQTMDSHSLSQDRPQQRSHQEVGSQGRQFAGSASGYDQNGYTAWPQSQQGHDGFAPTQMPMPIPQMPWMPMQTFQQPIPSGGLQNMNWNQFNQFASPDAMQQFHTSQILDRKGQGELWQKRRHFPIRSSGPASPVRDPIVPPSAASGGVPDPNPAYLAQTLVPSTRLPAAQALLLVIDLNGTLLFRPDGRRPKDFEARPHAAEFLQYVTKTFWVVIWSSAREENVAAMIGKLLPSYTTFDALSAPTGAATGQNPSDTSGGCALVAVWSRLHFGLTREDFNKRVQCYKRLTTLWNTESIAKTHPAYNSTGPCVKNRWDQTNTVLIDDSFEKARSEPHNLIQIEEFLGYSERKAELIAYDGRKEDNMLPQVHDYINDLCFQSDVSSYMRANPFKPSEGGWNPKPGSPPGYS